MKRVDRRFGRVRGGLLIILGALLGAQLIAPSVGNAVSFLTRKKADRRYLNKNEVRVSGAVFDEPFFVSPGADFTPLISTPIKARTAGHLFIVASVGVQDSANDDSLGRSQTEFRLRLDSTAVTDEFAAYNSTGPGDMHGDVGAITAVVPVTKGAHTVHLDAREISVKTFVRGRALSVLFVPAGTGAAIPA